MRESPGARATVDDRVLVKEPVNTLHRDSHHPKLAHDQYTGPWKIINVIHERLSFTVQLTAAESASAKLQRLTSSLTTRARWNFGCRSRTSSRIWCGRLTLD